MSIGRWKTINGTKAEVTTVGNLTGQMVWIGYVLLNGIKVPTWWDQSTLNNLTHELSLATSYEGTNKIW